MNPVQFEPKIATGLQIDWRRNASQGADPFADLLADRLEQRFESGQKDGDARRRLSLSDPVSGRPPRLALAHARTLRGEAREVEDAEACRLSDQTECAQGETCPDVAENAPASEEGTAEVDAPVQEAAAETQTDPEAIATADQPAQAIVDQSAPSEPTATIVVVTQPTEQRSVDCAPEEVNTPFIPMSAEGESAAPEQAGNDANAPANESQASPEAAPEQQAAIAAAEAGLSAVAVTLNTSAAAPAAGPEAPAPVVQTTPLAGAPATTKQTLPQTPEPFAPVAELAPPPAQPKPERPAIDIKPRPATPVHANAGAPDPAPSSVTAPQPVQPHQTTLLQPSAGGDAANTGDLPDQSLPDEATGQGWAIHLAQGAAGKRADFIAQLRQHLQNLPAHEQVAVHIQRAMREGTGKFSIQLSPAELGGIHVKLEIDEEKRVTAAVTVERPSTLELLQRDVKGLERALHNAGLNMEGGDLSFSLGHSGDQDFAQEWNQSAASAASGPVLDAESGSGQPDSAAPQVMDTATGVVDLQV